MITQEIADFVEADLIICGATGLNAVERDSIGSVSGSIVRLLVMFWLFVHLSIRFYNE